MPKNHRFALTVAAAGLALLAGCSDSNDSPDPVVGPVSAPFQELIDQGVTRYLGAYSPMLTETQGDVINHTFGTGDGPLCLDGSEFTMATRDQGSEELVIFLQGGGACWSTFCLATESAHKGIPKAGILDPDLAGNPVAGWNTVYVPYCDGGLHASDRDSDSDGDGQNDRFQRGLHNLSASLDVAVRTFPSPKRILLTGVSAGGFGTTYALPLVRSLYPDVPIELVNDSGLGLGRPGNPDFIRMLMRDWNMAAFIPANCENCVGADGHTTDYHKWELAQDHKLRLSMMSYTRDTIIGITFIQPTGFRPATDTAYPACHARQS
ncbi:MAG: vtpJ-therm [Pseudomonadales bacterium]|nr:vtpJ-therm [Pseudomonadales bacterium]MCP5192128.1 vtpJ-therm [Pseudomonadales bacterium]